MGSEMCIRDREEGESVVCDGIRLVVDRLDKNRIDRVHMYLPKEQNVDA